ncbi:MAG: CPBP family intramembrane metalloprotease [Oscillospiraceae bacterium]|nr:CPBP family intramembrane metalloprotease [Oscillospiraceae bacterium]
MREKRERLPFTSRMSRGETVAALVYLPIHIVLLPTLITALMGDRFNGAELNFVCYALGVLYMLACQWRFLRRDFDPLCDNFPFIALEVVICYGLMLAFNMVLNGLLAAAESLLTSGDGMGFVMNNPNNSAVVSLTDEGEGMVKALAVFLAPILEELMFRAGVFGLVRRYNRTLAYLASMLLFALYHVWGYALGDPIVWLYLLQYLPVSYLLCRCYERSNSIWGSIFLHMLINFISLRALTFLQELM